MAFLTAPSARTAPSAPTRLMKSAETPQQTKNSLADEKWGQVTLVGDSSACAAHKWASHCLGPPTARPNIHALFLGAGTNASATPARLLPRAPQRLAQTAHPQHSDWGRPCLFSPTCSSGPVIALGAGPRPGTLATPAAHLDLMRPAIVRATSHRDPAMPVPRNDRVTPSGTVRWALGAGPKKILRCTTGVRVSPTIHAPEFGAPGSFLF
jgi:hypothetical protein